MRIFKLARRSIGLQVFTQDLNILQLGAHFFKIVWLHQGMNTSLHFQLNSADFLTSDICPSFQRVHRHHNHVTLELRQSLTQWSAVTKNLGCFSCLLGWECSFLEGEQNLSKESDLVLTVSITVCVILRKRTFPTLAIPRSLRPCGGPSRHSQV